MAPYGRLSKGVHVTLPLDEPWSAALTIPHDQVRVTFAYPWEGMLLLGTTDTLYDGDPADVSATDDDIDHVLGEAGVAVDASLLRPERVLSTYAGLRVLPGGSDSTVDARRETAFLVGRGGMLTVAGGQADDLPAGSRSRHSRASPPSSGSTRSTAVLCLFQALPTPRPSPRGSPPAGTSSRRRRPARPLLRDAGRAGRRTRRDPAGVARATPSGRTGHRRPGRLRRPGGVGDERRRRRHPPDDAERARARERRGAGTGGRAAARRVTGAVGPARLPARFDWIRRHARQKES